MSEKFNENKDGKNEAGSLQTSGSGDNGMTTPSSEKPGWQFAGWYIDPECTKRINPGGKIPEMTSLYPKWVPIVYPVLYELEEGENSPYNPEAVSALSGIVKLYPAVSSGSASFTVGDLV